MQASSTLYARRRAANYAFIVLSLGAALFGLIWLGFILGALLKDGISALGPHLFTEVTPPPGAEGGLINAIFGSVVMSLGAVALGTPIGLFAGTYLAEYARHGRLSFVVRFVNDILLSAPSIVIGLFIYELIVVPMGHFSAIAGAVALTVIVIPVVVRTTENMLLLVPNGLREAATALGAPRSYVIKLVTWKAAKAGIITGVLLAIADPTAYVAEGSELDKEAAQRAFTVYMPGRNVPMIPRTLSDELCSLKEGEERNTLCARLP